jgi:hypothetical protein
MTALYTVDALYIQRAARHSSLCFFTLRVCFITGRICSTLSLSARAQASSAHYQLSPDARGCLMPALYAVENQ